MNNEIEFSILNVYFGTLLPLYILCFLIVELYKMFNDLGFILFIVLIIICIKAAFIADNEARIWAKLI